MNIVPAKKSFHEEMRAVAASNDNDSYLWENGVYFGMEALAQKLDEAIKKGELITARFYSDSDDEYRHLSEACSAIKSNSVISSYKDKTTDEMFAAESKKVNELLEKIKEITSLPFNQQVARSIAASSPPDFQTNLHVQASKASLPPAFDEKEHNAARPPAAALSPATDSPPSFRTTAPGQSVMAMSSALGLGAGGDGLRHLLGFLPASAALSPLRPMKAPMPTVNESVSSVAHPPSFNTNALVRVAPTGPLLGDGVGAVDLNLLAACESGPAALPRLPMLPSQGLPADPPPAFRADALVRAAPTGPLLGDGAGAIDLGMLAACESGPAALPRPPKKSAPMVPSQGLPINPPPPPFRADAPLRVAPVLKESAADGQIALGLNGTQTARVGDQVRVLRTGGKIESVKILQIDFTNNLITSVNENGEQIKKLAVGYFK